MIVARDGNDRIRGLDGNDLICAGPGKDRLWGGGGDDRLEGGIGEFVGEGFQWRGDWLMPGPGDDVLVPAPQDAPSADTYDVIRLVEERHGAHVDLAAGTMTGNGRDTIVRGAPDLELIGTSHDDVLKGTSTGDRINGTGGSDRILGRGGADVLSADGTGGSSVDRTRDRNVLRGGPGDDHLHGGHGKDSADGGPGDDYLSSGHDGSAELVGGDGADVLEAQRHVDRVLMSGGPGADLLAADNKRTTARGGEGNDLYRVRAFLRGMRSTFLGGQGDDTLDFHVYNYDDNRDPVVIHTDLRDGTGSYTEDGTFRLGGIDALEFSSTLTGDLWIAHGTDEAESFWARQHLQAEIHAYGGDDIVRTDFMNDVVWGGDGVDTADTGGGEDVCHEVEVTTSCESN